MHYLPSANDPDFQESSAGEPWCWDDGQTYTFDKVNFSCAKNVSLSMGVVLLKVSSVRIKDKIIMVNTKTITISGIGEVKFERSRRAKYVNISIRAFTGVRVGVPIGIPMDIAKAIAETKADWIKNQLRKTKLAEQKFQDLIKNQKPINIADAKKKIIRRVNELSMRHNIPFNNVSVKNQKSRWGSCSVRKNINLNIKIISLPDELMDYVILHELAHIRHNNHSKKYWQELDRIVGNAKILDKQLSKYELLLIWPVTSVN